MSIQRVAKLNGMVCGVVIDAHTGSVLDSVGALEPRDLAERASIIHSKCVALRQVCDHPEDLVFSNEGAHHLIVFGKRGAHLFYVEVTRDDANLAMTRFALETVAKGYEEA